MINKAESSSSSEAKVGSNVSLVVMGSKYQHPCLVLWKAHSQETLRQQEAALSLGSSLHMNLEAFSSC